jgi:hypothetical protein
VLIRSPGQPRASRSRARSSVVRRSSRRRSIHRPRSAGRNGRRARLAAVAAAGTATSQLPSRHAASASSTNRTASSKSTLEFGRKLELVAAERAVQQRAEVDVRPGPTSLERTTTLDGFVLHRYGASLAFDMRRPQWARPPRRRTGGRGRRRRATACRLLDTATGRDIVADQMLRPLTREKDQVGASPGALAAAEHTAGMWPASLSRAEVDRAANARTRPAARLSCWWSRVVSAWGSGRRDRDQSDGHPRATPCSPTDPLALRASPAGQC